MKCLNTAIKAYIAGFLDGDGSVYVKLKREDSYRYGYQIAPYIVFYQKDDYERDLEKLKNILGVGYLRKRKDGIVEYTIGDMQSLNDFIKQVLPFVRLKSRQLKLLQKILVVKGKVKSAEDFIKLCQLVDKFKKLNYSKKRTQTAREVKKLLISKGKMTP